MLALEEDYKEIELQTGFRIFSINRLNEKKMACGKAVHLLIYDIIEY